MSREKHSCRNLDFRPDEDELRQLFEPYGKVDRVSVMTERDTGRSRGFAFVEMTNAQEGEKAIAELNGRQLGGRTINVNEARPKTERTGTKRPRERRQSERAWALVNKLACPFMTITLPRLSNRGYESVPLANAGHRYQSNP
jgi:cold-inducible RNA-binding protein